MLDLLFIFIKLFLMANLSVLLLLYFPAKFILSCYFVRDKEGLERLSTLSPSIFISIGFSVLLILIALFVYTSIVFPLYSLLLLGFFGVCLEIYRGNRLFQRDFLQFIMFFVIIFFLCFGQYISHSLGHDEWSYFELLRTLSLESHLSIKHIAGLTLPSYGLFIPSLYVLSLGGFPLMAFSLPLLQALLLTILFVSIFGGVKKIRRLDLLVAFLLVIYDPQGSYWLSFSAAHTAFLMITVSLVLLMLESSENFSVQFFILLLALYAPLVHPSVGMLLLLVIVMVVISVKVSIKTLVFSVLFSMATATIFMNGGIGLYTDKGLKLKEEVNIQLPMKPKRRSSMPESESSSLSEHIQQEPQGEGNLIGQLTPFWDVAVHRFKSKGGPFKAALLIFIYSSLLFLRKRKYL